MGARWIENSGFVGYNVFRSREASEVMKDGAGITSNKAPSNHIAMMPPKIVTHSRRECRRLIGVCAISQILRLV